MASQHQLSPDLVASKGEEEEDEEESEEKDAEFIATQR